jgi:signal transduction histidine kinase
VSSISHELRTPLANIKLYLHLLGANPTRSAGYMATLERESTRLERIIESLLDVTRRDRTPVAPVLQPLDLNALCSRYAEDRSALAAEHRHELTFTPASQMPPLLADENLLGQVLSILLTNANNYTPAGGHIHIRALVDLPDRVGFSVADDGPGIPIEEQEHLFQRFFRGKASMETGTPGTGLGLSIARQIVQAHGGTIEVHSTGVAGEGATFTVWLPVTQG